MPHSPQFASATFALGAFCTWGVSDFMGGYTARRFQSFLLAALGHLSGTVMITTLALVTHETFPPLAHMRWACAAGAAGGISLALFYRALAQGNMGIAAPITAVLSAGIPTLVGMMYEGFPGMKAGAGF